MGRFILHQAVACGGRARGFNQGAASTNCAVYASDWLSFRLTERGDPFTRTTAVEKAFLRPVQHFPALYNEGVAGEGKIVVTVPDNAPDGAYQTDATSAKSSWGQNGPAIILGATLRTQERITPRAASAKQSVELTPTTEGFDDWLVAVFRQPGCNFLALHPVGNGVAHAIATFTTEKEFWLFDSLVGELMVPIDNVAAWYRTELAREHFTGRSMVSVTPLTIHG